jgi:hypothetical protein
MKYLFMVFVFTVISSAYAEDVKNVSARLTCSEIQSKISELSRQETLDAEEKDSLDKLKVEYRKNCSKGASKRKTSAQTRVVINEVEEDDDILTDEEIFSDPESRKVLEEPEREYTDEELLDENIDFTEGIDLDVGDLFGPLADPNEKIDLEKIFAEEIANLDAGLCANGEKPNKYGCCENEIFKDMGNAEFACCPIMGGDCFPPLNPVK